MALSSSTTVEKSFLLSRLVIVHTVAPLPSISFSHSDNYAIGRIMGQPTQETFVATTSMQDGCTAQGGMRCAARPAVASSRQDSFPGGIFVGVLLLVIALVLGLIIDGPGG
jgi:hypothetical protein